MPRKNPINELIDELSEKLETTRESVLERATIILGREVGMKSLHGIIGSKNNEYIDSVRDEFATDEDFVACWINGLLKQYQIEQRLKRFSRGGSKSTLSLDNATDRIILLLKDEEVRGYIHTFLARTFYRTIDARTRYKPSDELWTLWFNDNKQTWGLLIAPVQRNGEWTNDKSEMRHKPYAYWTVGHALAEGFVTPISDTPYWFATLDNLLQFYDMVLKRHSNSTYEQEIYDHYVAYIRGSEDPFLEPLLIPELRYAGKDVKHQYRLDFSVLNSHTRQFTGFEISPASTHMNVNEVKVERGNLTKTAANEHVKKEWEAEMAKRNDYFEKFGIITVTFTDKHLTDIPTCFAKIREALMARPKQKLSLASEIDALVSIN